MSLNKYIGKETIDNSIKSVFIQVIGGHCTGKSSVVGKIKQKYKEKITVLGKYETSKTTNGLLTGGMDGVKMDNVQRFETIKKSFYSSDKVVICEGMMIIYYSSFIKRYYELQKNKKRDVFIILLTTDFETIKKRLIKRSKGKQLTEKRFKNIKSKEQNSLSTYNKIVETKTYKKAIFNTTNIKKIDEVINYISKIIEVYI